MGLLGKIARYALRETSRSAKKTAKRALRKAGTSLFGSRSTPKRTTRKRTTTRKKVR